MKMRDKLGVPENLRTLDVAAKRDYDPDGKRAELMRFAREHDGEAYRALDVANALNWSVATVYKYLAALEREGRIIGKRRHRGYGKGMETTWHYRSIVEDQPKAPKTNGVYTKMSEELVEQPKPIEKTQSGVNQSDDAYVARTDREIWEFLRTADPRYVHGLSAFANHLHKQYLGENVTTKETNNG